jgi:Holliday junction resolvase
VTPKTDNRTTGGRFEQELSHILADNGFWVHVMQQNKAGQPADIIAVRGRFHTLIDCKVCDNGFFAFERIEDNQRSAMKRFFNRAGELSYFALKLPDESIRMVSLERCETLKNRGKHRISAEDMQKETWNLDSWLESSRTWSEDV